MGNLMYAVLLVEPPVVAAFIPVQQIHRIMRLRMLDRECVRLECVEVDPVLREQLPRGIDRRGNRASGWKREPVCCSCQRSPAKQSHQPPKRGDKEKQNVKTCRVFRLTSGFDFLIL